MKKDFESMSSEELWQAIASNARQAGSHTGWIEYLDNIKVLCALIDGRIQRFQHEMRVEQLLGNSRITKRAETSSKGEVKK
jgi:hypothetical protein